MIVVVDYDTGNTRNLKKALDYLGIANQLSSDPATILAADGLILPGVGAFQKAMAALEARDLVSVLQTAAQQGKPMLGICLGMQLLVETGYEFGPAKGLGLLPGEVVPIPTDLGLKVPHMGWNTNDVLQQNPVADVFNHQATYFVHSFYVQTAAKNIIAQTDYGVKIPSIIQQDNVMGMQFHPEKSGQVGLLGLARFNKELVLA
ncbi:imidazole glycerol phosphate synthase subunit HisH [Loigolactobacillus jiayinensis]|uniref:Imidazole glycerol phosphate synthase subunit HisH n=1 Tax=Loigolactobacillus jiayinensis TaxID=2486016 RepID=A0ABW1RGZ5_9LACO|nr:imidazole glycerol phosphate synthase subunit HisH [Loigolactobacillus jiayinensis]